MLSPLPPKPRAILFDLDGTLVDTAPDLAAAINLVRTTRGLAPTPYESLRPYASAGARGLIGAAFGLTPENAEYDALRTAFLDNYAAALAVNSCLFDGVTALLDALRENNLPWGIVTNKSTRLTLPLVQQIGLQHTACVICGDTTPHAKPHPEPLLEAARQLGFSPQECWYVGDDLRDIQAGQAASMLTIAANWGYGGAIEVDTWSADFVADTPLQVLGLLNSLKSSKSFEQINKHEPKPSNPL